VVIKANSVSLLRNRIDLEIFVIAHLNLRWNIWVCKSRIWQLWQLEEA